MQVMGLEAIYPKPKLSANRNHKVYPYLLRDVAVKRVTRYGGGRHVCAVAERVHVLGGDHRLVQPLMCWRGGCRTRWTDRSASGEMLEEALGRGKPEVFNTDQGSQFTAEAWTGSVGTGGRVGEHGRSGSLSARQRVRGAAVAFGVKYEDVYLLQRLREGGGVGARAAGVLSGFTTASSCTSPWNTRRSR